MNCATSIGSCDAALLRATAPGLDVADVTDFAGPACRGEDQNVKLHSAKIAGKKYLRRKKSHYETKIP